MIIKLLKSFKINLTMIRASYNYIMIHYNYPINYVISASRLQLAQRGVSRCGIGDGEKWVHLTTER